MMIHSVSIHSNAQIHCPYYIGCHLVLGLAKSGQNHQRFIDIAAATARMKNIHTTLEDSVYYPHLSDLNKTECVVHRQVPIDDACMLGGALISAWVVY
jgi:hypothetical protein